MKAALAFLCCLAFAPQAHAECQGPCSTAEWTNNEDQALEICLLHADVNPPTPKFETRFAAVCRPLWDNAQGMKDAEDRRADGVDLAKIKALLSSNP